MNDREPPDVHQENDNDTSREPLRPGSYDLSEAPHVVQTPSAARGEQENSETAVSSGGLDSFREEIHKELKESGAFDRIRALVTKNAIDNSGNLLHKRQQMSQQHTADLDVLQELLSQLSKGNGENKAVHSSVLPKSDRHYLKIDFHDAKAFVVSLLSHNHELDSEHDGGSAPIISMLVLHVHYKTQRFRSYPVKLAAEPTFDETVLFEIGELGVGPPAAEHFDILKSSEPVQLALMRSDLLFSTAN